MHNINTNTQAHNTNTNTDTQTHNTNSQYKHSKHTINELVVILTRITSVSKQCRWVC
jgi:hypothetical protein